MCSAARATDRGERLRCCRVDAEVVGDRSAACRSHTGDDRTRAPAQTSRPRSRRAASWSGDRPPAAVGRTCRSNPASVRAADLDRVPALLERERRASSRVVPRNVVETVAEGRRPCPRARYLVAADAVRSPLGRSGVGVERRDLATAAWFIIAVRRLARRRRTQGRASSSVRGGIIPNTAISPKWTSLTVESVSAPGRRRRERAHRADGSFGGAARRRRARAPVSGRQNR